MLRTTRTSTRIEAKKGAAKPANEGPIQPLKKSSQRVLQPPTRQLKRQRSTIDKVEKHTLPPSKPSKKLKCTDPAIVSPQGTKATERGRAAPSERATRKPNTSIELSASSTGNGTQISEPDIPTETATVEQIQVPSTSWDVEGQYKPTSAIVPRAPRTKYSDDCPDWVWDIRGSWDMDLPGGHDFFDLDPDKKITMKIQMCRTVSRGEVSRQLWAVLGSGSLKTFGVMRFCPALAGTKYIKEFEKACKLMGGSWPGPIGKGDQTWSMRCRAAGADGKRISDEWQTNVKFTRDDYGSLRASGILMLESKMTAFEAFKFGYTGPSYDTGFAADLRMSKRF
ncbi:hypothetical protein BGZ60DRAFT_401814 [Tricladium varicosporioides]|nr:hypothetical protein BGZ60DRAFT_401814 [Hymenoscyphus varicosporioides]